MRAATSADLDDIERIVAAAYEPYVDRIGRRPAPMDSDYLRLIETGGRVQVLEVENAVVGLIVAFVEADALTIENVAVSPTSQGCGFGRRLVSAAECDAAERGLTSVRLYTNAAMTENVRLYTSLGYAITGRGEQDGFDRVHFVKQL